MLHCLPVQLIPYTTNNITYALTYCIFSHFQEQFSSLTMLSDSVFLSSLIFTPAHNQTVLCPAPPYGPSTTMLACCCMGLTRYGHSEPPGRAAAARGGQRSTGLSPVQGGPPWAAAPLVPWGTQVEQERRAHSPQPSGLRRSLWK